MHHHSRTLMLALLCAIALAPPLHADEPSPAHAPPEPPEPAPLAWERLANLPVGVFNAALSRSGQKVVLTGGINQGGMTSDLVQVLDLDTMTWSLPLRLPVSRARHVQLTLEDGRVLVAGGQTGTVPGNLTAVAETHLIDLQAGTVVAAGNLTHQPSIATGHLLPQGQAVVIGGGAAAVFDPQKIEWVRYIRLREPRHAHASAMLADGRIVIVGGMGRRSLELLDVSAGVSRMLAPRLPKPLDDLRLATLPDDRVYVLGGQDTYTGETTDATWVLDLSNPQRATLTEAPPLGIAGGVADHTVVTIGPWIVSVGGESERQKRDTELADARIIDGRTLKVFSLPPTLVPHDDAVGLALGTSVLIFGGYRVETGLLGLKIPSAVVVVERLTLPPERLGVEASLE